MERPLAKFAKMYAEIGPLFERAKIETTWRGFFLRADTQHDFSEPEPSATGLWVTVQVLDAENVKSAQQTGPRESYEQKVIAFRIRDRSDDGSEAMLIGFHYGKECDQKVVSAILKAMEEVKADAEGADTQSP